MLLNDSVGQLTEGVTAEDIEAAPTRIMADLAMAAENASNFSQRNNIELDLAYLSGDWRGLPGNIERFLNESDCNQATWAPGIIAASGLADRRWSSGTRRSRGTRTRSSTSTTLAASNELNPNSCVW